MIAVIGEKIVVNEEHIFVLGGTRGEGYVSSRASGQAYMQVSTDSRRV